MQPENIAEELQKLRRLKATGAKLPWISPPRDPQDDLYWKCFQEGVCGAFGLISPRLENVPLRDYIGIYESNEDLIQCEREWMLDDSQEASVFSFRYLCDHFSIDYKRLRACLLNHLNLGKRS